MPGRRRALVLAVRVVAVLFVAAIAVASRAAAARRPGTRVTVALFGDSVTESILIPTFVQDGMAPQLARAEASLGFTAGGAGLISAAPFRWHYNASVVNGTGSIPKNGWLTIGPGREPGYDGPSGYSAVATSPLARATVVVSDPEIEILYNSTNLHCPFKVSSAGRTWTIDTFRPGPMTDTGTSLHLPAGRHQLTIHGPSCGVLSFDGVIARRPVPPGQVQVEVENLGHSGKFPWVDFAPRVQQSLVDQHYGISVFLYGYLGELLGEQGLSEPYLSVMTARARIARAAGGACLIAEPTPLPVPQSAVTLVAGLDRTVARRAGCTYTNVLSHLWSSPTAGARRGLVLVDGIHPTAAGYKLIAHALAPIVARMVHAHLRH